MFTKVKLLQRSFTFILEESEMSDEPGGSQDGNPNLFRHKQIIITTDIFQSKNQIVLIEDLLLPPFASLSKIILLSFLFVYTT